MTYVLDACALIALLDNEDGKDKIDELFTKAKAGEISLYINIINLLEVYYEYIRADGIEVAGKILAPISETPLKIVDLISQPIYKEAARLKGAFTISLADAVGLATAINLGGIFVTSDGEFKKLETREETPLFWFRPPKEGGK
jgi:predicted nucleic acid-binding protein